MLRDSRRILALRFGLIMLLLVIYVFPVYWMVVTSFRPPGGDVAGKTTYLIPRSLSFESYAYMLRQERFLSQFYNSLVVAATTTAVSTILATLAGYGLSRFTFRGRHFLATGILIFQMFPKVLLIIPYFLMMRVLGLLSTNLGLILAYTSFTQPFCIWMLVGFFDAIPTELDECAMVDGANRFRAFWRVIVPLAAPGIAATALFAFVLSWHEYLFSLVLAVAPGSQLLPQGLAALVQEWDTIYEAMMAGAVMVNIPVVVVYVLLERYFVSGLTAGAVKG
jgi:ABC-type glycerol-3-phosphate transport system permease component